MFFTKEVCALEGGQWYGDNPDGGTSYSSCCEVQRNVYDPQGVTLKLLPIDQQAVRNDNYKLVQLHETVCGPSSNPVDTIKTVDEFYQINEKIDLPMIDKAGTAICGETDTCFGHHFTEEQSAAYQQLTASLSDTLNSEPPCPGDGNSDKVVNFDDVLNWYYFSTNGVVPDGGGPPNTSSWYDFNHDGKTDFADLEIIAKNFSKRCMPK
jgi:hypothetical protein